MARSEKSVVSTVPRRAEGTLLAVARSDKSFFSTVPRRAVSDAAAKNGRGEGKGEDEGEAAFNEHRQDGRLQLNWKTPSPQAQVVIFDKQCPVRDMRVRMPPWREEALKRARNDTAKAFEDYTLAELREAAAACTALELPARSLEGGTRRTARRGAAESKTGRTRAYA